VEEQVAEDKRVVHELSSEYRYNGLNQPVWQKTPDGGVTEFWYDRLGRIVLSQNSKQKGNTAIGESKRYSYTLYDAIGRTIEVGEVLYGDTILQDQLYANPGYLNSLLIGKVTREITRTYYDFAAFPLHLGHGDAFGTEGQKNLLHRVSSVVYYPGGTYVASSANPFEAAYLMQTVDMNDNPVTIDALPRTYQADTHYSYDIHGNVHRVVQEFRELEGLAQSFKRIDYTYDLLSGKVTQVAYQQNRPDQFFHRYLYDADNKLLEVQTSPNGFIWDRDVRYEYHLHGALARTVLGDWSVQGIDFAYTLPGWLKGVNGDGLNPDADMGEDHHNLLTARDAMQFGLSYYNGDYQADALAPTVFGAVASGENLYNGNISGTNMRIPGSFTAMAYQYDQLNRLTKAQHKGRNSAGGWDNRQDYTSTYAYDANGTLMSLNRNGSSNHQQKQQ
jgi:hypothetical protein